MRIAYIYDALARVGGVERILVDKMNYLSEYCHYEVYLITAAQGNHGYSFPLSSNVKHIDINVRFHLQYQYKYPKRLWVKWKMHHLFRKELRRLVTVIDPDIIIGTTYYKADVICELKCRAKKIIESHCAKSYTGMQDGIRRNPIVQLFYKFRLRQLIHAIEKKSNAIVVLTQGDALEWSKKEVFIIPNIVPRKPTSSSSCKERRVIAAGRLIYQKGFDRLIESWAIVTSRHPDWQLDIYGEGEEEDMLKSLINQYHLNHVVTIHSFVSDITKEYLNSSIYALSSNYEGFGLVLVEAMACGIPCVSFDCPHGPSDIIKNQEDGILVKNGDIKGMAKALCQLIENENQRIAFGKKAKENVSRFLPEKVIPQWDLLFNSLIK